MTLAACYLNLDDEAVRGRYKSPVTHKLRMQVLLTCRSRDGEAAPFLRAFKHATAHAQQLHAAA
eukprot:86396-Chlamydomonas_euryale.AAC.28